jgi:RimJ/RimL family protein N-acetyltransferase
MLETDRLRLRSFIADDAPLVQTYCADPDVARTTLSIPHPYEDGMAAAWIATHEPTLAAGEGCTFAVERCDDGQLVGAIGLRIEAEHRCAELGYVIYKPFWGRGYATEAAIAVIRFGFEQLELNRIEAHHFGNNPASGRVMEKARMTAEGTMRERIHRWGEFHDTRHYAILRADFDDGYHTPETPVEDTPS